MTLIKRMFHWPKLAMIACMLEMRFFGPVVGEPEFVYPPL